MISAKNINLIAWLLIGVALLAVVIAMLLPKKTVFEHPVGTTTYGELHTVTFTEDDFYQEYNEAVVTRIDLGGTSATASSKNVKIDGNTVSILGGGVYVLSGTLEDGCVVVDSPDDIAVRLVLHNAHITSSDFAALYIKRAEKTVLSTVASTTNTLTDGAVYDEAKLTDGKPTAALYSKDDLIINGSGSLTVQGNFQDGIKANDTLKITQGSLTVQAVDEGINANDSLVALDVQMTVTSGGDAVRCEHETEEKGFVAMDDTTLTITAGGDGISASSAVYMNEITARITAGGGSENAQTMVGMGSRRATADMPSTKAIKAGTELFVNGGNFTLDSVDDALHSDGDFNLEGGEFTIATGGDAVHAQRTAAVNPKSLNITQCMEGIEGAYVIINGGEITVIARDDGINATGENSAGSRGRMMAGRGGNTLDAEEDIYLTINGGNIHIESSGDGIDSNGSAVINSGSVFVYGPENDGNGSIDVGDGGYVLIMNGGTLLAAGSSGMAEYPYEGSTQNTLAFYLEEGAEAGSTISVVNSIGEEILSGTSNKRFDFVCVSTAQITQGETYRLLINGSETATLKADSVSSTSGNARGGFMGFGRR